MSNFAGIITIVLLLTLLGSLTLLLITVKYYWGERGTPPLTGELKQRRKEEELRLRAKQIEHSKKNPWKTRGGNFWDNWKNSADRRTIEREIDALIALASSRELQAVCPSCGTSNTNDSRFCRVCGIANAAGEPAELEVLRLTANARTAYQKIVGGTIFILCWIALFLPACLLSHQSVLAAVMILGGGALVGLLWNLSGIVQLNRALNPSPDAPEMLAPADYSSQKISAAQIDLLPMQRAHTSVTEGTTELLNPLRKKEVATDEVGTTNELQQPRRPTNH